MDLNKEDFFNSLNAKDYMACITMLRKEIINTVSRKIQEHEPDFKYTNLGMLKTACFNHLGFDEQNIVCKLYDLENKESSQEEDLSDLMELYKMLVDIN